MKYLQELFSGSPPQIEWISTTGADNARKILNIHPRELTLLYTWAFLLNNVPNMESNILLDPRMHFTNERI